MGKLNLKYLWSRIPIIVKAAGIVALLVVVATGLGLVSFLWSYAQVDDGEKEIIEIFIDDSDKENIKIIVT